MQIDINAIDSEYPQAIHDKKEAVTLYKCLGVEDNPNNN